ncbi:MAG: DUF6194 family protein [Parachlamydiales bacterium]|jgi:hypothetical protein
MDTISPSFISNYLLTNFADIVVINSWGETSFFYNPGNLSPRGTYFCTIKDHDGENDKASALHRDNFFRLNFGISKLSFLELFKSIPKRPPKGGIITGTYDFTEPDTLYPHPVYGWMCWVAITNPSERSFKELEGLLLESYQLVLHKHQKK